LHISIISNALSVEILTMIVGIITLVVLIIQTMIFLRQSSIMAKQAAISETQIRVSEAVAISLEPTWAAPGALRIGVKNEGKGTAHDLNVGISIIDTNGQSVFQGGTSFQSVGPNSTQERMIEGQVPGSMKGEGKFQFHISWTATASDGTAYKGSYQISNESIRIEERRREWPSET
jgi:hypothetical protein